MCAYRDRRTPHPDQELLSAGSGKIREPLKALYNVEDEIALIAWELARWQPGLGLIERQALIMLDPDGHCPSAGRKHPDSACAVTRDGLFASTWRVGS